MRVAGTLPAGARPTILARFRWVDLGPDVSENPRVSRSQSTLCTGDPWRICVAPMMDWTDRHCRYLHRLLAPGARLYTEMLTARAVVHGDPRRLLEFSSQEHPVALQLAGSDADCLAEAAAIGAAAGYDEINLNAGCPSARVSAGAFGACLMKAPALVASLVASMSRAVSVPVTVKTRIGVDDRDDYAFLNDFVAAISESGCETVIIHARKALLSGLSPSENRTIPPLRYETVYRIKRDFPRLRVVINGGVDSLRAIAGHLDNGLDGVMIGRKAYHEPYWLSEVAATFLDGGVPLPRAAIVAAMSNYATLQAGKGTRLRSITRHMLGLYHGSPGARSWRRFLSEQAAKTGASPGLLLESLALTASGPPPAATFTVAPAGVDAAA